MDPTPVPFRAHGPTQGRLRKRESRKPPRMACDRPHAWVMDALRRGWSPEPVEGRLKTECPNDPVTRVGHERLYQWIHTKPQKASDLRRYLPRGKRHRTRAKAGGRRGRASRCARPSPRGSKRVDSRRGFGHFESDTAVGTAPSKRCVDTQVERKAADCSPGSSTTGARARPPGRNATSTGTSRPWRSSTAPGTTAPNPPCMRSWTNRQACPPTTPTPAPHANGAATRTGTAGYAATCPGKPFSRSSPTTNYRPSSRRSMKLLDHKTPNEVWQEEITRPSSQPTNTTRSVALTN